jgi:glycosyltransferase involved in cell wall biosynthesis
MQKPFKLIYKSSYDRGLEHLLKMWPKIREKIPTATLDICYGWQTFLSGYSNNPYMMNWKQRMDKLMEQDGITHHGRVSKKILDDLTSQCDVWAYYCIFDETNCITALDSQRLGCVPITMARAGLLDTVYSGTMIEGDGLEPETKQKYLEALVYAYENPKWVKSESEKGKAGIEKFYWSNIAKEWEKEWLN